MIWVFDKNHKSKNSGFIMIFAKQKMTRKRLSKNGRLMRKDSSTLKNISQGDIFNK